ncbi:MAG: glycosyltransferase family 39 protein [Fibrobacter sp.]|nr:glycosyltransferase family 39 protein [Fibrobacter sp.]
MVRVDKIRIGFWLILALGIFARVFLFGDVPGDINQDEAFAGYNAFTLMHSAADSYGYRLPVYLTAWGSGMNALESYLMIPFVAIFGLKVWVIRLPMLIVGILSLVAVYHLVRRFSSGKLALAAMFLVAISPWHIMLSRWALESNLAPGFVLFGILFFVKGLEKPKLLVVSALSFGLSLYAYATVWSVVPFIVIACVAYALWARSLRHTRYVWISLGVLVALACPLVLFLLVNKGVIPEIKLPFLSIPKLVYFRDSEISFAHIPRNLANLANILVKQNDYLPWNSFGRHGLYYPATLAFFLVGFCVFVWNAIQDIRRRRLGLSAFVLVWLFAGLAIGALIQVNVNRVNLLFLPLLIVSAFGIVFAFERIHVRALVVPLFAYLICFATFEKEYFTTYRDRIGNYFCEGIEDAMNLALSKSAGKSVVVDPDVSYPRVLFYGKVPLDSYLSTVKYTNFPSAFLYVRSFDKYIFTDRIIPEHRQDFVYLLENSGARMKTLQDLGYNVECFGKYVVGY